MPQQPISADKVRKDGIAKALKVIKTDCRIAKKYEENGKTCAIGALAVAAKIRLPGKKNNEQRISAPTLTAFRLRLSKHYGLDEWELGRIQALNDAGATMTDRRRYIAAYLKDIEAFK
jgi:hypothetical protein